MKKFLKILGIAVLVLIAGAYIYFLKFLPEQIDLNVYIPQIQKAVKEQTDFNIKIGNIKLFTTPSLQIGAKISDVSIDLPDGSTLFRTAGAKAKLSLLRLFLLNVRVSEISVYKPYLNLEIANNKEFKAVKVVESLLNEIEKNKTTEELTVKKEGFDPLTIIRIDVPDIKVFDYRAYIYDKLSDEYLLIRGDKAKLGYFNGKRAALKTKADLYLNKDKQVGFDIDINSFIPKPQELDEEDDPAARAEMPFINPVLTYKTYDPKGEIIAKLKIDENKKGLKLKGEAGLEDLTLNINGYKIPKSHLRAKFSGNKTFIDTDLYLADKQSLAIYGTVKQKKHPDIDLTIFSNGVYFNDIILLSKAIMDSLGIKNALGNIKGQGCFVANANIKTNSKTIKSDGSLEIKNGAIINSKTKLGITDIKANVLLNENTLKIKDTGLKINNGNILADGLIDQKGNTDIKLTATRLPIAVLFNAFAPNDIKSQVNFSNGYLNLNANIKGKLKDALSTIDAHIENLVLSDKLGTCFLTNEDLKINAEINRSKPKKQDLAGRIQNSGFRITLPYAKSAIKNNEIDIDFNDEVIALEPTEIKINSFTNINLSGTVKNYMKNPEINITSKGNLYAAELKQLLGTVCAPFIDAKGVIPVKLSILGNAGKQTLRVQIASDKNNYITPVHIQSLSGSQTVSQALIDFKRNRLKIKDTGLFVKQTPGAFSDELEENITGAQQVIGLDGTIMGLDKKEPVINLIRVNIQNPLAFDIAGLKNSKMELKGNLSVFGNLSSPRTKGGFILSDISIPDIDLKADNAKLSFSGKEGSFSTEGLTVNGSDIKLQSKINLASLPILHLYNTTFNSNNINADKIIETSKKATALIPKDQTPKETADIPVVMSGGKFDIKNAKTGAILAKNISGDMSLFKNIFYINNFVTDVFKGKAGGNVNVNLINSLVNVDVRGNGMDTNEALITLANMKDTLTGKLSFDTKLSLSGATYEDQVKSLDGVFHFLIENGQAGPFAKIENLFLSENIRNSEFFQTAIGSFINSAVSFDTSRFKELEGKIAFDKTGIAHVDPITMTGSVLCIKIGGDMDILNNELDAHVRGRLGSAVSSVLGPLANVNPVNIVKATPGLNVVMAKTFSVFCEKISKEEMNKIPDFTKDKSDLSATKFQLILRGDVAKPLSMLKSFKWLVTEEEYKMAEDFVSSIPENMPEGISTLEELRAFQAEVEQEREMQKTLIGKVKFFFKKDKKSVNL